MYPVCYKFQYLFCLDCWHKLKTLNYITKLIMFPHNCVVKMNNRFIKTRKIFQSSVYFHVYEFILIQHKIQYTRMCMNVSWLHTTFSIPTYIWMYMCHVYCICPAICAAICATRFPEKYRRQNPPGKKSPQKKNWLRFSVATLFRFVARFNRVRIEDSSRNRFALNAIQRDFFGGIFFRIPRQ